MLEHQQEGVRRFAEQREQDNAQHDDIGAPGVLRIDQHEAQPARGGDQFGGHQKSQLWARPMRNPVNSAGSAEGSITCRARARASAPPGILYPAYLLAYPSVVRSPMALPVRR